MVFIAYNYNSLVTSIVVAKNEDLAKAYWQEGMYTEEEVKTLCEKAHFVPRNIDDWFNEFKKK